MIHGMKCDARPMAGQFYFNESIVGLKKSRKIFLKVHNPVHQLNLLFDSFNRNVFDVLVWLRVKITAELETKPISNPARSGRSSYKLIKLLQLLEETEKSETTGIRESTSPSGSITTPDPWWHIIDAQHLKQFPDDFSCFSLITIHPIELARQITLLTHDYICETRLDELRQDFKLILLIGSYFHRIRIK